MESSYVKSIVPVEVIEKRIFIIRREKVMIDRDLAELYEVETKYLNRQVKRNIGRFPSGFMFRLTKQEKNELVTNCHRLALLKHSTSMPYAFTEQGVAMLSSVLKSERAIQVNVLIMQTFVRLRKIISSHKQILRKIDDLEKKYDYQFKIVFDTLRNIVVPRTKSKHKIGFIRYD